VVSFIVGDVHIENDRSVRSHKLYHLKSYRVRVVSRPRYEWRGQTPSLGGDRN